MDPEIHQILFVEEHLRAPDKVMVSMMRNDMADSYAQDRLFYSFFPNGTTKLGFTLATKVVPGSYKTILLGYITLMDAHGFDLLLVGI